MTREEMASLLWTQGKSWVGRGTWGLMMACLIFAKECMRASVCLLEVWEIHPSSAPRWFLVLVVLPLYLFGRHDTVTKAPTSRCLGLGGVISEQSLGLELKRSDCQPSMILRI